MGHSFVFVSTQNPLPIVVLVQLHTRQRSNSHPVLINMAFNIGSVFLGDSKKRLGLSASTTSTPPSSPPGTGGSMSGFQNIPSPSSTPEPKTRKPQAIDPLISLELRLRWIEALVLGSRYDPTSLKGKERERRPDIKDSETVCRSTETLSRKLQTVVDGNDGLKRFMSQCAFV